MQEVNVKVAVRVRPLLPKEKLAGEQLCVRISPNNKNQLILGRDRTFTFDHVLAMKSIQEEVYVLCVQPLVTNIFEGYNATVFAYGQTGSGKTFTIGGGNISQLTEDEDGVIPRAIIQMFDIMKTTPDIHYSLRVSYIEIYKEELEDLLDLDTTSKDLHLREDDKGNTVIIGAREVECETLDEVMSCLESGSSVRHTGSTLMNEHSSRSHSIFTIVIDQKWREGDVLAEKRTRSVSDSTENMEDVMTHFMSGKFHFVDLAGSERAHRTGNVGDRFKESVHINSGLLALGNVISALGDPKKKVTHIPYRESKITRILKNSLGGNAKTLMICCISPSSSNLDETLNCLKYANRAKNIKNKPIINRDIQSIRFEEMQTEIMALREELARQRSSLQSNVIGGDYSVERAMHDANQINQLDGQVTRLQTECTHYRMIAEEAYKQLIEIQHRDILSKSQHVRLKDWLDLMEEIKNKVPSTLCKDEWDNQTIKNLQVELKKCKDDLQSDEEIFAEKMREMNQLLEKIEELESNYEVGNTALAEADERLKKQERQLVEQQMTIGQLQKAMKERLPSISGSFDIDVLTPTAPVANARRPKSVPVHLHKRFDPTASGLRPPSRNIHTSPALFSLDRVMQGFRARSQLLLSRLEDSDEVLHQTFSDDSSQDYDDEKPSDGARLIRKGTFRVKNRVTPSEESQSNGVSASKKVVRIDDNIPRIFSRLSDAVDSSTKTFNVEAITSSTELQRKKIKQSQLKMLEANQKIRDLAINIRLKEQLIRELVKTGKDAEIMNHQYAEKIVAMEMDKGTVRQELIQTQKALQDLEVKGQQNQTEKQKLEQEYKKKIEASKSKMSTLQKKQKDTEKVAGLASQNTKKIHDMELAVDKMKQQHDQLQKRFKDESDHKLRLEHEMQKEQQRTKELEIKNEKQQKVLKRKNEEIAAAQRKLRSGSLPPIHLEDHDKLDEQKKWLDNEIEKVVEQRKQMEDLQMELRKREEILARKERMIAERSELEIKKLRSSQVINKNLLSVSKKLESVEKKIEEKSQQLIQSPEEERETMKEELARLRQGREKILKQRLVLDERIHEGSLLTDAEERRQIELDEAIEAMDAAIEYKNDSIHNKEQELRRSHVVSQAEDQLMNRLNSLTASETRILLSKYFEKVINLRDSQRKKVLHCSEMEVRIDEQERLIREMEHALQRCGLEMDRKLTQQQKEHEQRIQLLLHQLADADEPETDGGALGAKIQHLEKDLYYYKKTSRDLKKRLKEVMGSVAISQDVDVHSSVQNIKDEDVAIQRASYFGSAKDHRHSVPRESQSRPTSSKSEHSIRDLPLSITPVKISRRELRPLSDAEVSLRHSQVMQNQGSPQLHDSLDATKK